MKCHTIDCARNTFLLLQKHLGKVVTNARVRLQEVVRQNGGHIEHVLH